MKRILAIIALCFLAVGGAYAATVVTELHSFSKTYTERMTVASKGKTNVYTQVGTVSGTITDQDTIPDPVTVTNTVTETVTVTTGEEDPPPPPPIAPFTRISKAISTGGGLNFFGEGDVGLDLQMVDDLTAEYVRMDARWNVAEPSKGVYDWTQLDHMYNAATARGLKVLWIVLRTPAWARGNTGNDTTYPVNPADYGDFAQALALRYDADFELWNEPNGSWAASDVSSAGAAKLAAMIRDAYPKIKAAQPDAYVISGGILRGGSTGSSSYRLDTDYLSDLYANGIAGFVDAIGFHPYSYPHNPTSADASNGWNRVDEMAAIADKGIWITEWGQHTGIHAEAVSEANQALFLSEAWQKYRTLPEVEGPFFVYQHRDGGTDIANKEHNFGLARNDRSHKPVWDTYVSLIDSDPTPPPPAGETLAAGASLDVAFDSAVCGKVYLLASGSWPSQSINGFKNCAGNPVKFIEGSGNRSIFGGISIQGASDLWIEGVEMTLKGTSPGAANQRSVWVGPSPGNDGFAAGSKRVTLVNIDAGTVDSWFATDLTIRGGDYGPCDSLASGNVCGNNKQDVSRGLLIENALFHDLEYDPSNPGAHHECMYINGGQNATIRNNRFERCAIFDLFVTISGPDAGAMGHENLRIENNFFDCATDGFGNASRCWSSLSIAWCQNAAQPSYRNITIRGNNFDDGAAEIEYDFNADPAGCQWQNVLVDANRLRWNGRCQNGWTYTNNIFYGGTGCGSTNIRGD